MDSLLAKRIAAIIFYGSFTVIPSLVWVIANFYEHISYTVLSLMAVMPMFVFHAIRGILEEAPPAPSQPVAASPAASVPESATTPQPVDSPSPVVSQPATPVAG